MPVTSSITVHAACGSTATPPRSFSHQFESLRPTRRGFVARIQDWLKRVPTLNEQQRKLARIAHTEVRYHAALAGRLKVERPQAHVGVVAGSPLHRALAAARSDPSRLFDAMQAHADANAEGVRALLEAGTPEEVVAALADVFRQMGDRWQARSKAQLVHAALSARVAVINDQPMAALRQLDADLLSVSRSGEAYSARFAALARIEGRLAGLDHAHAPHLASACAALRARLSAQLRDVSARTAEILHGLKLDASTEDIQRRLAELAWLVGHLEDDAGMQPAHLEHAQRAIAQTRSGLALLETRESGLNRHKATCPELTSALRKLDAPAYMQQALRIQHVLGAVGPGEEDAAWVALEHVVGRGGAEFEMLQELCDGDNDAYIDSAFQGARWHETAAILKHSRIDRTQDRERLGILMSHPVADQPKLLAQLATRIEQRRQAVDIQHNLRIASDELDRVINLEAMKRLPGSDQLPAGAFKALAPSKAWIDWLRSNAPKFVRDTDLMIANWIRLSFTNPATRQVDIDKAQPLLALLQLSVEQMDQVRQWVAEGFPNAAAVTACRRQIQHFATTFRDAALVSAADEAQDQRAASQRIVKALFHEMCGEETLVTSGDRLASTLRRSVARQLPWIGMEAAASPLARERDAHLASLATVDWGMQASRDAQPRQWLRDPAQRAELLPRLQPLLDFFGHHRHTRELNLRKQADPQHAAISAELRMAGMALAESTRALARLDMADLRLLSETEASGRKHTAPSAGELLKLQHQADAIRGLMALSRAQTEIDRLRTPKAEGEARAALDKVVAIAILQEALASGDPDFRLDKPTQGASHVAGVFKRLKQFGLGPDIESPYLRARLAEIAQALSTDTRTLTELNKALAPRGPGVVQATARGIAGAVKAVVKPASAASAPRTDPKPMADDDDAASNDAADETAQRNAEVLERRFRELQAGQSFAIFMGQYGDVAAVQPVVPGVSLTQEVRLERSSGINVSKAMDGRYQVHLQDGIQARCGVSLETFSALVKLTGSAVRQQRHGHRFTFADAASCERFVQALARGDATEPQLWADALVEATKSRESGASLLLAAKVEASVGGLSLAALSAEVGTSTQVSRSSFRTAQGEVQQDQWHVRHWVAGRAEAAGGKLSIEGQAGRDLSVNRSLVRQYGLLQSGSGLTLTATVIGGNVERCLAAVLPHLDRDSAEWQAIRKELGELPDGTAIALPCRMSDDAIARANQAMGDAQRELIAAARTPAGAQRDAARNRAREHMAGMHAILGEPASYVPQALRITEASQATAARRRGVHHAFSTVSAQSTRSVALAGAAAPAVLTDAYRPLLA